VATLLAGPDTGQGQLVHKLLEGFEFIRAAVDILHCDPYIISEAEVVSAEGDAFLWWTVTTSCA
jgi:hypothetical protein